MVSRNNQQDREIEREKPKTPFIFAEASKISGNSSDNFLLFDRGSRTSFSSHIHSHMQRSLEIYTSYIGCMPCTVSPTYMLKAPANTTIVTGSFAHSWRGQRLRDGLLLLWRRRWGQRWGSRSSSTWSWPRLDFVQGWVKFGRWWDRLQVWRGGRCLKEYSDER